MCSSASSRLSTVFTAATSERNSRPKSSGAAGVSLISGISCALRTRSDRSSQCISTPASVQLRPMAGRNSSATSRWTRRVSRALQMLNLRVLALWTTGTALAISAVRLPHNLHRVRGHARLGDRRADDAGEDDVGVDRLLAAAQDAGVSGLQAERGDVHGDVGPALIHGS